VTSEAYGSWPADPLSPEARSAILFGSQGALCPHSGAIALALPHCPGARRAQIFETCCMQGALGSLSIYHLFGSHPGFYSYGARGSKQKTAKAWPDAGEDANN